MRSDFSSVRAKFHRAEEHIDTFEKEVTTWVQSNPYRVAVKHNADRSRYWAVVETIRDPNLERWSLIAWDAVHNLRTALDHLIYSVAIFRTQQNPPPRRRDWTFPIRGDQASLQSTISNKPFPKLGNAVLKEIERFQPYNRPHNVFPPLLTLLQRFDNSDKHHILRVPTICLWGAGWDWNHVPGEVLPEMDTSQIGRLGAEVKDGTKVGEITFLSPSEEANPKFSADLVVSVFTSLSQEPLEMPGVLPELAREVRTIIERICKIVI